MGDEDVFVDFDALTRAARAMTILVADFDQARATIAGVNADDFGNAKASAATREFVEHWGFQAQRLSDAVQTIGGKLQNTVSYYSQNEEALVTGLTKMTPTP